MQKFVYVDVNGFYQESAGAYETSDFIATSAGAGDAGKPIVLDSTGHVDASMIDDSDIDHGNLTGLGDDDHTQYILVAGTRAFTGDQSMGSNHLTSLADPTSATIDSASDDAVPMSYLASTANGEGASTIGIEDANDYFVANTVEGALAELYSLGSSPTYTVGVGGVTKGDLVYISGNNTVSKALTTTSSRSIGLAASTALAAATVKVTEDDTIVTGVLSGATAGTTYYWNGTAHTATIPAASGAYVWKTGIAKNATDLHSEVEFIKRNA
jgi:hypothetical protein